MDKKARTQWIVNILLLVFSLLVLTVAVLAWFKVADYANVDKITVTVIRKDLKVKQITTLEFPYATKIADSSVESAFNGGAAIAKEYIIEGEGKLSVSVDCQDTGMLAYVCASSSESVSYDTICAALESKLGTDRSKWTYEAMENALNEINNRQIGDFKPDSSNSALTNTHVKIIYWVEYEHPNVKGKLETGNYVDLNSANGFSAFVTFVDES